MENTTEEKLPIKTLERIDAKHGLTSYEEAARVKSETGHKDAVKTKIVARRNGTFDVIWFKKKERAVQAAPASAPAVDEPKKEHGLKSKERKKKGERKGRQ